MKARLATSRRLGWPKSIRLGSTVSTESLSVPSPRAVGQSLTGGNLSRAGPTKGRSSIASETPIRRSPVSSAVTSQSRRLRRWSSFASGWGISATRVKRGPEAEVQPSAARISAAMVWWRMWRVSASRGTM